MMIFGPSTLPALALFPFFSIGQRAVDIRCINAQLGAMRKTERNKTSVRIADCGLRIQKGLQGGGTKGTSPRKVHLTPPRVRSEPPYLSPIDINDFDFYL